MPVTDAEKSLEYNLFIWLKHYATVKQLLNLKILKMQATLRAGA